jgi:hypothetical protein
MMEDPGKKIISNTVERLIENAEEKKRQDALTKEEMDDLRKAVNSILSSKDGKLFWRMSKKMMKIDAVDHDYGPINMAVAKAYRNYYNVIMNMVEPDVRIAFEQGK